MSKQQDKNNNPSCHPASQLSTHWSKAKQQAWLALEQHAREQHQQPVQIRDLISNETHCDRFSFEIPSIADNTHTQPTPLITADLARHPIDQALWEALLKLAETSSINERITAMFQGERINYTEGRAALHTRLRTAVKAEPVNADLDAVRATYQQMQTLATKFWNKSTIKQVIHVGIGGSDFGPRLAVKALQEYHINPECEFHFVANIDPLELNRVLQRCEPEQSLIIICTKSFSTLETLHNAQTLFAWLGDAALIETQVIAITNNVSEAKSFGIHPDHILPVWEWVGGRYSLWSTIGFTLLYAIGQEQFDQLRLGGLAVDQHFTTASPEQNLPLAMALLGVWYNNFYGSTSHCVIPYDHALEGLPNYLQQLDMESNGKGVDHRMQPVNYATGPIIWGSCGTNSQHSFHQLLHQGTQHVSLDFLLPLHSVLEQHQPSEASSRAHLKLIANCLAQSEALISGRQMPQEPYRTVPGNRPHSIISYSCCSPTTLGALIALYEHKVFCQAVIWEINPFDQWGVELGKQLAHPIYAHLLGITAKGANQTTNRGPQSHIKADDSALSLPTRRLLNYWFFK